MCTLKSGQKSRLRGFRKNRKGITIKFYEKTKVTISNIAVKISKTVILSLFQHLKSYKIPKQVRDDDVTEFMVILL